MCITWLSGVSRDLQRLFHSIKHECSNFLTVPETQNLKIICNSEMPSDTKAETTSQKMPLKPLFFGYRFTVTTTNCKLRAENVMSEKQNACWL